MTSEVYESDAPGDPLTLVILTPDRIHVKLRIEPNVLSTALQQILAGNPGLEVEVCLPKHLSGEHVEASRGSGAGPVVEITLLESPFRFRLATGGREWLVNYRGLDDLTRQLADLDNWRAAFEWPIGGSLAQSP